MVLGTILLGIGGESISLAGSELTVGLVSRFFIPAVPQVVLDNRAVHVASSLVACSELAVHGDGCVVGEHCRVKVGSFVVILLMLLIMLVLVVLGHELRDNIMVVTTC